MKMSRWVRWLLVSVVLVMLTACGGNPVSPDDNGTTDTPVVHDDNGTTDTPVVHDDDNNKTDKPTTKELAFDPHKINGYQDGMDLKNVVGEIENQYWIRAFNRLTEAELREMVSEYSTLEVVGYSNAHGLLVQIPDDSMQALADLKTIEMKPGITSVRKRVFLGSGRIKFDATTKVDDNCSDVNDSEGDNWHLGYLHMPEAWKITTGDKDVLIGVADAGFYEHHEDISYLDFKSEVNHSHGTAVAGTIAAKSNNGKGVTGINWKSGLVVTNVIEIKNNKSKEIDYETTFEKIFGSNQKVKLINNSFSSDYWEDDNPESGIIQKSKYKKSLTNAIRFSRKSREAIETYGDKLFIFSAGNDGMDAHLTSNGALHYNKDENPEKMDNVIVVAAILKDGILAGYSNFGKTVDIAAPTGVKAPKSTEGNISTYFKIDNNESYGTDHIDTYDKDSGHSLIFNGTSAAAPMVTGVASLIYSLDPDFIPKEVKHILIKSAKDSGRKVCTRHIVAGYTDATRDQDETIFCIPILDAGAALKMAKEYIEGRQIMVDVKQRSFFDPTVDLEFASSKNYPLSNLIVKLYEIPQEGDVNCTELENTQTPIDSDGYGETPKQIPFETESAKRYAVCGNADVKTSYSTSNVKFSSTIEPIRRVNVVYRNSNNEPVERRVKTTLDSLDLFDSRHEQSKEQSSDKSYIVLFLPQNTQFKLTASADDYNEFNTFIDAKKNLYYFTLTKIGEEAKGAINGYVDLNESRLGGVSIELWGNGQKIDSTTSDEDGYYKFDNLPISDDDQQRIGYEVRVNLTNFELAGDSKVILIKNGMTTKNIHLRKKESNIPPTANAGADQQVASGVTVTLDGSGSGDSDGQIVSYVWTEGGTQVGTGVSVALENVPDGVHTYTLTVTDDDNATASDSVVVTVSSNDANLSRGLVAHYAFDGSTNDSSTNGYNGVASGTIGYDSGAVGQSVIMEELIKIQNFPNLSDALSIGVWVYAKESIFQYSDTVLLSKGSLYDAYTLYIKRDAIQFKLHAPDDGQYECSANYNFTNGSWYHIGITYDKIDGKIKIYGNGVEVGECNYNSSIRSDYENDPLYISTNEYEVYWENDLEEDDLRIYNRALSEAEVQELYKMGNANNSSDDSYEENDDMNAAYDLSNNKNTWLSNVQGKGKQSDDDWYKIYLSANDKVTVELEFSHGEGDIDLALYGSDGEAVNSSTSSDDNEMIAYQVLQSGYYYIQVFYGDKGNLYDMRWNAVSLDDNGTTDASAVHLKKTGQTIIYDVTGDAHAHSEADSNTSLRDDGYYQTGVDTNYTRDDSNEVVIDHVTGLMWQDNSEVNSSKKKWLTLDMYNQCENDESKCSDTTGDTAATYCANLNLHGITGWRLPTSDELMGIMVHSKREPSIDPIFQTRIDDNWNESYWSSTSHAQFKTDAWVVWEDNGWDSRNTKTTEKHVRCVKVFEQVNAEEGIDRDSQGIVSDKRTGLQWQDNYDDNNNETKYLSWHDAIRYCEDLELGGHTDWRLPNINELYSLVDKNNYDPAINTKFVHVDVDSNNQFWSSTTLPFYDERDGGMHVNFEEGRIDSWNDKTTEDLVRCVRTGEH